MNSKTKFDRLSVLFVVISLCCAIVAMIMLTSFKASGCELSNDYLFLKLQDDVKEQNYGGFMLFKNGQKPDDTLTYSQFYSSFATIDINGSVKRFSDGEQVKAPYTENNDTVVTVQNFDGIEVTQRLSFSTGASDKLDMLKIGYSVENKTNSDALVSIRLLIDPTLSDSETDLLQSDGKTFKYETSLSGAEVPSTWCIKNSQGNISAYGITSDEGSSPDIFQAANWHNLFNNRFGYVVDSSLQNTDNAAALTWNDKKVASGATFSCSTKYGLYSSNDSNQSISENNSSTSANSKPTNKDAAVSPKTGKNMGYVFVFLAACSAAAAVVSKKKGAKTNV